MTTINPLSLTHQVRFLFILILGLLLIVAVSGCSAVNQLRATTTPTATATNTSTPTPTNTPTPTSTPTPIPPPQGEWSQYWDNNQMYDLVIDGKGYLWGRGPATVIRRNIREGTYQEFGIVDGLPENTADKIFWVHRVRSGYTSRIMGCTSSMTRIGFHILKRERSKATGWMLPHWDRMVPCGSAPKRAFQVLMAGSGSHWMWKGAWWRASANISQSIWMAIPGCRAWTAPRFIKPQIGLS